MVDKEIVGQVPKSVRNLRKANKIFNTVLCVIIVPILIINLTMFVKSLINKNEVPSFLGYKFFVVLTGSMQNTLNIGDFVVSKEINAEELKDSDIISFREENTVITHRIVNIEEKNGELLFTTKGDNNNTEDTNKVTENNIEGKFVFKISAIGKIISFFQSIWGIVILILIPCVSIILSYRKEERANMKKVIRKNKRLAHTQKEKGKK